MNTPSTQIYTGFVCSQSVKTFSKGITLIFFTELKTEAKVHYLLEKYQNSGFILLLTKNLG